MPQPMILKRKPTPKVPRCARIVVLAIAIGALCLSPSSPLAAQTLPGVGGTTLELTPATPAPGTTFTVRVDAYSYDIGRAQITWSVNGSIREEFSGEREITLTAPPLGEPLAIRVALTEPSGTTHTASHSFAPSTVELVVEGDTRVPGFYQGRALPSKESGVRLIALPSLYSDSGTLLNPETLLYTWRVGTQVVKVGVGADVLETTMPRTGALEVVVTVESEMGSARHVVGTRVQPADSVVRFYEDNPLYGLSYVALPEEFTLLAQEISLRAEPYFTSRTLFAHATAGWTLDGRPIENPEADPQTLTLRAAGGAGSAHVVFSVRNLSALLQAASGAFRVYFTE